MSAANADELARLIRAELADQDPQGFLFNDHVVRQDTALERLSERLRSESPADVDAAAAIALRDEVEDGWTLLKLLELVERLTLTGATEALLQLVQTRARSDDERSRFLAGRASEVLLKLPLDLETRNRANAICKEPLEEVARFRMSAQRARTLHRPRQVEWALLLALMLLGLAGVAYVFLSRAS